MKSSDLKYLLAYSVPLSGFIAVFYNGIYSWTAVLFAFGFIPLLEVFAGKSKENLDEKLEKKKADNVWFDVLLYLNIPVLFCLIYFYLNRLSSIHYSTLDLIGKTLSVGIVMGACINVAHELGHKKELYKQWMSKLLLLPNLYMHFYIEHNRGHHVSVATPHDPSTSRKGEMLYVFWIRSTLNTYLSAWKLESVRLNRLGKSVISFENEMIQFQVFQMAYLIMIYFLFGITGLGFAIAIAVVGFLLLETINYIEHYGLLRKKLESGSYERVDMRHSWNSNHEVGRIILYELTRHSDHHYKSQRKYQVLRHYDQSPQLPVGYPGCMLMALFPPLWFWVMDKRLLKEVS